MPWRLKQQVPLIHWQQITNQCSIISHMTVIYNSDFHHNNILSSEMWHCAVGQAVPDTLNIHTSCIGLLQKMNAIQSSKTSATTFPATITSQKTKKPSTSHHILNHFNTHKRPQHDCLAHVNQSQPVICQYQMLCTLYIYCIHCFWEK